MKKNTVLNRSLACFTILVLLIAWTILGYIFFSGMLPKLSNGEMFELAIGVGLLLGTTIRVICLLSKNKEYKKGCYYG